MSNDRVRVLLVEDAEPHVEAIRRAFEKAPEKTELRVAASLQAYREAVAAEMPDIALLDLNLPDGRCLDLLTWPPEDGPFPQIVLTSQGDEDTAVAAMKAGALDYIVKSPAAFGDIPRAVHRVLREWRLRVERKRAEESLQHSRQWMDLHVQHTPLAVIEWDANFNVREWNPAAERIFGYTRAEALGRHYDFIVPDPARPAVDQTGIELIENRGGSRSTNENVTKAGKLIMCEWFNTTLVDGSGKTMGVASLVQDITARRSLEAQLRESQKLEAVGQLAGGVAHDYNNILSATVMTLCLLEDRTDLGEDVRQAVRDLHEYADRAIDLTRQLLLFSRRSPLNVRSLNLNQVLTDLHKMLHRLIGEHIEFEFTGAPGLPPIQADRGMIEQVVTNLCVNARDAMPKGGRLMIRTSLVDVDPMRAGTHPDARVGRFVGLWVTDTGIGMPHDVISRIFEPFFTTKEKGKGTGLGLSTVFGIARQHNGWIEVESTVGIGSTFRVLLPTDPTCVDNVVRSAVAPAPGGNEVILLVEDEISVRSVIAAILRRSGYRVLQASDAQEARRVWRGCGSHVDVLYTDVIMPGGMTGLELAALLKSQQPDLAVVISSGYSDDLAGPASSAHPDFLYLPKPVLPHDLLAAIRTSLDGGKLVSN